MKKTIILPALLLVIAAQTACAATGQIPSPSATASAPAETVAAYQTITAKQAKERMDSGDDVIIVDVRTQQEYEAAHISGAILIPNETIDGEQPACLPDLDAEILVYCRTGRRSAEAAQKLADMGYTNIYDFGGIVDWPYLTIAGPMKEGVGCYIGNQ